MLSHQRWPYVGRFARDWHRLPRTLLGQPQTRTRAHPRIGMLRRRPQSAGGATHRACRYDHVDRACARNRQGPGTGGRGRPGREHVVDQQHPIRRTSCGRERSAHRGATLDAAPTGLRCGGGGPSEETSDGQAEFPTERARERPRLIVAAVGQPTSAQRYPRDHVCRREPVARGDRFRERGSDVAPARELQTEHGLPRRTFVAEGGPDRRDRWRWAIVARGHGVERRRPAARTPGRNQRLEGGPA
jgi:hypothetical protein